MNKKITVNKKLISSIESIVESESCIGNVPEFNDLERRELFQERPERWTEIEHAIFEHTERVRFEIMKKVKALLKFEEVESKKQKL